MDIAPDIAPRVLRIVGLILLPLVVMGVVGFAMGVHPYRYTSSRTPADLGWSYEPVTLRTRDGVALSGWFIPRDDQSSPRPVVIVLHGYPFDKANVLGVTPFLHRHYDLLLIDFRYFGQSEGNMTTLGHREWQDLLAAVEYARGRGASAIGVWGFSLGGSVALLTLPHTDAITAVAAESPFSDMGAMIMDYYRYVPIADRALAGITEVLSHLVLGVAPGDVSPVRAVAGSTTPILLIHSNADTTIPVGHYHRLQAALADNPNAEFWLLDGAAHGMTYASGQASYEERVLAFFTRHLN